VIIYHPAYDVNHCAFRFITLLSDIDEHQTEWETLKLLDFYYVFPHLLADMRLPQNPIATKQSLKNIAKQYESLPEPRRLLFGLRELHNTTVRGLVAKGIADKNLYLKNIIKLYTDRIPEILNNQIDKNEKRDSRWYKLIVKVLAKYPVNGKDGLKDRTQLMEFRYDTK
jgi:hypothetical protein